MTQTPTPPLPPSRDQEATGRIAGPGRWVKPALGGAAVLVLLAGGAFVYATRMSGSASSPTGADGGVTVRIAGQSCDPNALSVPAGTTRFNIVNDTDRAVEWEILDGVMVIEERENIAPGFTQSLNTRLDPGVYEITCGLLGNPRGKLTVVASADSNAAASRPPITAFLGALAEYRHYVTSANTDLQKATDDLVAAVDAGDYDKARTLYGPARQAFGHLLPVTIQFSDLDMALDARASDYEAREKDPAFAGFHRLEYGLFSDAAVMDTAAMSAVADQLKLDVAELGKRIDSLRLPPERMLTGARTALGRLAAVAQQDEGAASAPIGLVDFEATAAGSQKIAELLHPLVEKSDPTLAARLKNDAEALRNAIDNNKAGSDVSKPEPSNSATAQIASAAEQYADDLSKAGVSIGLTASRENAS